MRKLDKRWIKAKALHEEGWTQKEIAKEFGVASATIKTWLWKLDCYEGAWERSKDPKSMWHLRLSTRTKTYLSNRGYLKPSPLEFLVTTNTAKEFIEETGINMNRWCEIRDELLRVEFDATAFWMMGLEERYVVPMKTYEVVCEGVVQRMVLIEAANAADAAKAARQEFCALTGAEKEGIAILDIYSEPVTLKEIKNVQEDME